jgi:acetate kinase
VSILVINAGSSSLKFGLFDSAAALTLASGLVDWRGRQDMATLSLQVKDQAESRRQLTVSDFNNAAEHVLRALKDAGLTGDDRETIAAVGHRVVHGGARFRESVRIDDTVKQGIRELAELAPLHNPPALAAINASEAALPSVPHIAIFDTSFFATLPPSAFIYPLPYAWYTDWGVRRFGFHGISHAYCAQRAAEMLAQRRTDCQSIPQPPSGSRLIVCHLGNGCSATAIRDGAAVATTMGFTPMEGLMMGSRSGSVDPGVLLHVQRHHGLSVDELDQALNHESGLCGVSGVSSDYRQVEASGHQGNERARLALEIYAGRVRATIGALAVTLGGVDALVFTAGVGEHSASLREAACQGLECVGLQLDPQRNKTCVPDTDIAAAESRGRILAIHTREELMIARETRRVAEAGATISGRG